MSHVVKIDVEHLRNVLNPRQVYEMYQTSTDFSEQFYPVTNLFHVKTSLMIVIK